MHLRGNLYFKGLFYSIQPITHCLKWNRLCFSLYMEIRERERKRESRGRSIRMNL